MRTQGLSHRCRLTSAGPGVCRLGGSLDACQAAFRNFVPMVGEGQAAAVSHWLCVVV